jgi:hypothetical protein
MGDGGRTSAGNVRWAYNQLLAALQARGVDVSPIDVDGDFPDQEWGITVNGEQTDVVVTRPPVVLFGDGDFLVKKRRYNLGRNLYGAYGALRLATELIELVAPMPPTREADEDNVTPLRRRS